MRLRQRNTGDRLASASPPAALSLRRVATWGLVVLTGLLILDGRSQSGRGALGDGAEVDPVEAARPAVTAALGEHLRSRNGSLSREEQRRVIEAVLRSSPRHALDPYLVTAVLIVQSGAPPSAQSGTGASGLMPVLPHNAG